MEQEMKDACARAQQTVAATAIISCDICRDLMPLVRDGVASDDSAALVAEHTAGCEGCRAMLETGDSAVPLASAADETIIRRLRNTLLLRSALFALVGVAGGFLLTKNNASGPYLMWWLPFVGAASYFVMRRRWWLAPVMVGALVTVGYWVGVGGISLSYAVGSGCTWAVYTAIGTALGALLHFALGKEK